MTSCIATVLTWLALVRMFDPLPVPSLPSQSRYDANTTSEPTQHARYNLDIVDVFIVMHSLNIRLVELGITAVLRCVDKAVSFYIC